MRLLNSKTYQQREFVSEDSVPPYAILSHTWGDGEVTFQDIMGPNAEQKLGYRKIRFCCEQAIKDKLDWVWVDT